MYFWEKMKQSNATGDRQWQPGTSTIHSLWALTERTTMPEINAALGWEYEAPFDENL
jgi:hypothetical protein